jgi:excisionase family DNA binding protein
MEVALSTSNRADYRPRPAQGEPLTQEPSALLSKREVAVWLGVSLRTLRRWRLEHGYGPPIIRVGRFVRYHRGEVEAWIAEQHEPFSPP